MDQYVSIAEELYCKVRDTQGFTSDYFEDLNRLIGEFKKKGHNNGLLLKYNFKDFDDLIDQISINKGKKIDLSLMPTRETHQEFILWFAGVLALITDEIKPEPHPENIYTYLKNKPKNDGQEIMDYLKYDLSDQ